MKLFLGTLSQAALVALLASALRGAPPAPFSAATSAETLAAETFAVDGVHSSVIFRTKHLGVSEFYGRFNEIGEKSQIVLDGDKSSVLVVIAAASVDTNSADRDNHLRSPDFLNVKEFPEIVFESKTVKASGKEWEVAGDLSFHGVTKPVTAKARQVGTGEARGKHVAGFVAELTIDMNAFGIAFVKQNPGALGPEVHLTISLECVRQ